METKHLLVNFLVTFVAAFLAISLFAALHMPPRMPQPGEIQGGPTPAPNEQPMPPQAQMPAPGPGTQSGLQQPGTPLTQKCQRKPGVPEPVATPEKK